LGHCDHARHPRVNVGAPRSRAFAKGSSILNGWREGPDGAQTQVPPATHNPGRVTVKRALAALVGIAFVCASAGLASAQTPAPAMKPEDKKMEKKEKKDPQHPA